MRVRCEDSGPLFGPEQAAIRQRTRRGARRKLGRGIEKLSGRSGGSVGEVGRGVERRFCQLDGGICHAAPEGQEQAGNQYEVSCHHNKPPGFARYVHK